MNRWVLGARPRTLPAAVVPVLVGTATAAGEARREATRRTGPTRTSSVPRTPSA